MFLRKGQLCRPVLEEANAMGAISHCKAGLVPDIGPQHGRKATWVGASSDQTFLKVDEALVNPHMLENSLVFANKSVLGKSKFVIHEICLSLLSHLYIYVLSL